jgi:putative peptidoglycan lipid II flippase
VAAASLLLALFVIFGRPLLAGIVAPLAAGREEALLALLGLGGAAIYGAAAAVGFKLLGLRLGRF